MHIATGGAHQDLRARRAAAARHTTAPATQFATFKSGHVSSSSIYRPINPVEALAQFLLENKDRVPVAGVAMPATTNQS
jgi:hypothetical protein